MTGFRTLIILVFAVATLGRAQTPVPPAPTPNPAPANTPLPQVPTGPSKVVPAPAPARPQGPPPASLTPVAPGAAETKDKGWPLSFPSTSLSEVIEGYQDMTGKKVIRDPHIENAVVSIELGGHPTKEEAIEFMEKSLLLAGYAFVPSGENMVKIIAFEAGRSPASERVDMIVREADLPQVDKVVSFVLPLNYIKSEEAAQAFSQIVPPHPYGKIVAVPNARALVITENSNTIRAYIDLAKQVDLPPSETKTKSVHLERADAEEVAKALSDLLGISGGTASSSSAKHPSQAGVQPPQQPRPANPQQAAALNAAQVNPTATVGESDSSAPKLQALPRLNNILIMARPLDIEYIESLISEFDAESKVRGFISKKFRYLDVMEFVSVAKDALLRGAKGGESTDTSKPGDNKTTTTTTPANNSSGFGGGFGGFGGGYGGIGGGMGGGFGNSFGSSLGGGGTLQEKEPAKTQSILIGKTLVIVDPSGGRFYASGPPEQLRMLEELATELDRRPQQILISCVIGSFTLSDNFQFGLDWVRTLETFGSSAQNAASGTILTSGNAPVNFTSFAKLSDFPNTQGLSVYGQIGKNANVFLNSLEGSTHFRVLQRPTVPTLNHKLATISIGQQLAIPGQTLTQPGVTNTTAGVYSTTQYIPVELRLEMIPHIYASDEVKLEFSQKNFDVANYTTISGNQVPNLSTQELKNSIIIPNGSTILLGGLITDRDNVTKTGLPILSNIPVLKWLFGTTNKTKTRNELLIFVQPQILPDGETLLEKQDQVGRKMESYGKARDFADPHDAVPNEKNAPRALPVEPDPPGSVNLNNHFQTSDSKSVK